MEDLIKKVEEKIKEDALNSKTRSRTVVYKRHYLYYLLRKHGLTYTKIGVLFGKNHATVIHGRKTYINLTKTRDKFLINCLQEYLIHFENYDIEELEFSILYDIENATSWRDIAQIRKRIKNKSYKELK